MSRKVMIVLKKRITPEGGYARVECDGELMNEYGPFTDDDELEYVLEDIRSMLDSYGDRARLQ